MRRTIRFVKPSGTVLCRLSGRDVEIPVVQGVLKHLDVEQLSALLGDPVVAVKYTIECLRVAPWPVLRLFPREWLLECLPKARLREGRIRALEFMLAPAEADR